MANSPKRLHHSEDWDRSYYNRSLQRQAYVRTVASGKDSKQELQHVLSVLLDQKVTNTPEKQDAGRKLEDSFVRPCEGTVRFATLIALQEESTEQSAASST